MWLCTLHTSYCFWSTDVITSQRQAILVGLCAQQLLSRSKFWPIEHLWTITNGWQQSLLWNSDNGLCSQAHTELRERIWSYSNVPLLLRQQNYIHSWLSMDPHSQNSKVITQSLNGDNPWPRWQDVFARTWYRNVHLHTQETTHSTTLRYPNVS